MIDEDDKERKERRISDERYIRGFDFFVVVDFKKFRNVEFQEVEDEDGEKDICAVIPLTKNGIKSYGRDIGRMILGAKRRNNIENFEYSSHYLQPVISKGMFVRMKHMGLARMYNFLSPILGMIVSDVMTIPHAPMFCRDMESSLFPQWLKKKLIRKMEAAKRRNEAKERKNAASIQCNGIENQQRQQDNAQDNNTKKENERFFVKSKDMYDLRKTILNMNDDD